MPSIQTSDFGHVAYDAADVYLFPGGLHGFENHRDYLVLQRQALAPFCFLQSVSDGALRFICLPARAVDPSFVVEVGAEDASELNIPAGCYGPAAPGIHVLAIVTIPSHGPTTANLFAPLVLSPDTRRGRQCIQPVTPPPPSEPAEVI